MNILQKTAAKNPKTTILIIIDILSIIWNLATENAAILGVSAKAIMIGSLIMTAIFMIYNVVIDGVSGDDDLEQ